MHFSPFSRSSARTGLRRRRHPSDDGSGTATDARRRAGMGIEVQPVHGRHCICERCQRGRR